MMMINRDHCIQFLKCLYAFFKPQFYNRVTWVVVISGLGCVSTTFIEIVFRAMLDITFDIRFTDGSDAKIGVILIAIALTYNAFMMSFPRYLERSERREKVNNTENHDIDVFYQTTGIFDDESYTDILSYINTDHSCSREHRTALNKFRSNLDDIANHYLIEEIDRARVLVLEKLQQLMSFIAINFFQFQGRSCLYPDKNVDRAGTGNTADMAYYDEKSRELDDLVEKATNSFNEYRKTVKKNLYI